MLVLYHSSRFTNMVSFEHGISPQTQSSAPPSEIVIHGNDNPPEAIHNGQRHTQLIFSLSLFCSSSCFKSSCCTDSSIPLPRACTMASLRQCMSQHAAPSTVQCVHLHSHTFLPYHTTPPSFLLSTSSTPIYKYYYYCFVIWLKIELYRT